LWVKSNDKVELCTRDRAYSDMAIEAKTRWVYEC
jgi:hypothetical protein